MLTDKAVKKIFFNLEEQENFFDYCIDSVSIYFILRFNLEMYYRRTINSPAISSVALLMETIINIVSFLKVKLKASRSVIFKNFEQITASPFLFVSTSDWTIAEGESMELVDIIKYYKSKGYPINFVQPDFSKKIIVKQCYHDGFYSIDSGSSATLKRHDRKMVKKLLRVVSEKLDANFNRENAAYRNYVALVLNMADQLSKIIISSKAKYVFARSVYTEPWITIACNKTNTKCIEVQHGVVAQDNVYYQSALNNQLLLFPDYIVTLGNKWTEILIGYQQKYNHENVFTLGRQEMPVRKKERQEYFVVLICLQPGIYDITTAIVKLLVESQKQGSCKQQIQFIIRPHPNAFNIAQEKFAPYINEFVTVENPRQTAFYDSLNKADMLVSASSMCLYEALSIGLPTVSFSDFRGITINEGIYFVNDHLELMDFIRECELKNTLNPPIEYLAPFNSGVLDKFSES